MNKMQSDLLKKEDEFYKENEKLEQRTKELMKKVNDVMKIQENLIKETLKTKIEYSNIRITDCDTKERTNELNYLKSSEDIKDEQLDIPDCVNQMGKKGVIHFYRAKIKSLQDQNSGLFNENKKRGEEVKKLQKENQAIVEEKDKWFASYNTAKNTIGKLESQVSLLNSKLQNKDSEMASLRKEIEQVKKELKNSSLNLNNVEVRLNRTYEDNEKLRIAIKSAKEEEKDLRDSYKKQISDLTATVKQIEQHKTGLLNGFKKQLQLIDILKRQKLHLEACKVAELSEAEYLKILDWKLD